MSTFTSFKYYINNTIGKVEGSTTLDLNSFYTSTMTKVDVVDINNTLTHSYFGEGNLKDSKISEGLMCTVLSANNTNVFGEKDSCFYDGKINHDGKTEYISMKASRRAHSSGNVISQTPLKLYQFFNMTSGRIDVDDAATHWRMVSACPTYERTAEFLKMLLDNQNYCESICAIYDYVPNESDVFSVATSYPGTDGLVYIEKTCEVSATRMFVAAVTIQSMALHGTEQRLSVKTTTAVFGSPVLTVGIALLDPTKKSGKFAAVRELVTERIAAVNDIEILKKINKLLDKC